MYKGTKFREIMDNIEAAVLKSLDQAKEGVSTVTEKTADVVEELERKANKRERIKAIKEGNKHRARYSKPGVRPRRRGRRFE